MAQIAFTCKDPLLAKYYEQCFGDWFARELEEFPLRGQHLQQYIEECWRPRMLAEAKLQEHYDFTEHINGDCAIRIPVFEDGEPKLLIPEVTVTS